MERCLICRVLAVEEKIHASMQKRTDERTTNGRRDSFSGAFNYKSEYPCIHGRRNVIFSLAAFWVTTVAGAKLCKKQMWLHNPQFHMYTKSRTTRAYNSALLTTTWGGGAKLLNFQDSFMPYLCGLGRRGEARRGALGKHAQSRLGFAVFKSGKKSTASLRYLFGSWLFDGWSMSVCTFMRVKRISTPTLQFNQFSPCILFQ